METLEVEDTDLAEEIKKRMFVFEDILTLDNRSIQDSCVKLTTISWPLPLKEPMTKLRTRFLPICPNVWLKWSKRTWNSWVL